MQHVIHQLDRRGLESPGTPATASIAAASVANCGTSSPRTFGRGTRFSSASVDHGQRPFAADDQLVQAGPVRGRAVGAVAVVRTGAWPESAEHVEVVAADAAENVREAPVDLSPCRRDHAPGRAVERSLQARRTGPGRSHSAAVSGPNVAWRAVGQDDVEAADVVDGLAVDDGAAPAELLPIMPPRLARLAVADLRAELQAVYRQRRD